MVHQRLSSLERTARLTDAETVMLGRLLIPRLGIRQVVFPDDAATTTVLLRDVFDEGLPALLVRGVTQVLGPFEVALFSEWTTSASDRLVTPETPGMSTVEEPSAPVVQLFAPGRGATVLCAYVLSDNKIDRDGDGRKLMEVRFPGLPLWLWQRTIEAGVATDASRPAVGYEVIAWEVSGESVAPTGAPLHEIHATLRQVTINRR